MRKHPRQPLFSFTRVAHIQGRIMSQDVLAQLLIRRDEIRAEMKIRLDELDRLINLVSGLTTQSDNGSRLRRRRTDVTIGDIIERPILDRLLAADLVTTKEMATILPDKKLGPLVSAWKRRAVAAGAVFNDLVERSTTPAGDVAFSLTTEGRHVFGLVAKPTSVTKYTEQ